MWKKSKSVDMKMNTNVEISVLFDFSTVNSTHKKEKKKILNFIEFSPEKCVCGILYILNVFFFLIILV